MIAQLTGRVASVSFTEVILDVNGIGFLISIPVSTYDILPPVGGNVTLLTFMAVREDAIQLFGFGTKNELDVFKLLITVNGIGAKIALAILSSMNISSFCTAVVNADIRTLKKISGVGPRSAERIVVELRDKLNKMFPELMFGSSIEAPDKSLPYARELEDALLALEQLGFVRVKIRQSVADLTASLPENQRSSENIIRQALRSLSK